MSRSSQPPVLVVATWAEAAGLNAIVADGVTVVSVAAGTAPIDGLRVGSISATQAAVKHPAYAKVYQVLLRSQIKCAKALS